MKPFTCKEKGDQHSGILAEKTVDVLFATT